MKKDLIIFVCCGIAATTIESTGIYFMIPLVSVVVAVVLTIDKLNKRNPSSLVYDIDQLLDYSTRNDMMED